MEQVYTPKRQVRRLEEDEIIESFSCGDADLDDFIVNEAPFYRDALLATRQVAVSLQSMPIALLFLFMKKMDFCHYRPKMMLLHPLV